MSVLNTEFEGSRGDLFQLAMKTGFLTVLTLGFYRFWQTTRFRRWYWSSVRPGGTPFEYTGTGQEKFIGFLAAVILLALFLAFFNAAVMFVAIRSSDGSLDVLSSGVALTPIALVPILFAARYRARRYILARTRWRGIRFGMSSGAWGYAWRACLWTALGFLSLGLLWPIRTFRLEKYLTDHTWFGDARFTQFGRAGQLYGPFLPFLVTLWGSIAMMIYGVAYGDFQQVGTSATGAPMYQPTGVTWPFLAIYPATLFLFLFGVYYRVASFRVMAAMKILGDGVEFDIHPRTRTLVWINILGSILTFIATGVVAGIVIGVALGLAGLLDVFGSDAALAPANIGVGIALFGFAAITVYVFHHVFRQIFITFPMVRHVVSTLEVHEPSLLANVRQRDRDGMNDAGGFAEALGAGAAF